jgi:hypothetical protein
VVAGSSAPGGSSSAQAGALDEGAVRARLQELLGAGVSVSAAARQVAGEQGVSRSGVYQLALGMSKAPGGEVSSGQESPM